MVPVCSTSKFARQKLTTAHANVEIEVRFAAVDELLELSGLKTPVYFDSAYLKAIAVNDTATLRHIFPCIYVNGKIIAYGAFCLLTRDKNKIIQGVVEQGNKGILFQQTLKTVLPFVLGMCDSNVQILIAGNILVSGPYGLHFIVDCTTEIQSLVWSCVLKSVDEQYGAPILTVAKDFLVSADAPTRTILADFFRIETLPLMVIHIPHQWKVFDDYLDAMSTKYRTRAKAALNKGKGLTTEYWDAHQISRNNAELHALYLEVFNRAKFRIQAVTEAYLPRLAKEISDGRFRLIVWKDGEKLVGFNSAFFHNGQLDAHLIGMNYAYNKTHSLYLNMIYRYIEEAIELRANRIDFGRTAMEIKSAAGAIPQNLDVMLRLKSVVGNKLAKGVASKIKTEAWIQRHPFKLVNKTTE